MPFELTADKVQKMEEFYQRYYQYVNNTQISLSERKDPAEFIDTLLESQSPLFEQLLGKPLDFNTVTREDVRRLAALTYKDGKRYGTGQIDDSNYKDVLIDISRQSMKKVLEHTQGFDFLSPTLSDVIAEFEEVKMEKPVMPRRLAGLLAASSEQMDEYRKQMDLYQKQQERFRINEKGDDIAAREDQREAKTNDFYDRLEKSRDEAWNNSEEYLAVVEAMRKVNQFASQTVNQANTKDFLEAHQALGEACKHYIETREGAMTGRGSERLELIKEIYKFQSQEAENLGEMREEEGRRKYDGKSFSEAIGASRTKKVRQQEDAVTTVSGATSKRHRVATGSTRGYFSEEESLIDVSSMEGLTELGERLKSESTDEAYKRAIDGLLTSLEALDPQARTRILTTMGKQSVEMKADMTVAEMRKSLGESLQGIEEDVPTGFHASLGTDQETTAFKNFMKGYSAETTKAGAMEVAGIESDAEMGKRNIATSRMASLLGIGHLIAHSERMELQVGSRMMTGVFMDDAVGSDLNKREHEDRFTNIKSLEDPTLQKQLATIYAFDLICGQLDRHPGNMLYQLEERDGVTRIKGIQGIDNDLAFGTVTELNGFDRDKFNVKHGGLAGMDYIGADFAQRLSAVKREDLDYALGDLLSKEEIDAVETRLQKVRDKAAQIPQLRDDQWDLTTIDKSRKNQDSYTNKLANRLKPTDYVVQKGKQLCPADETLKALAASKKAAEEAASKKAAEEAAAKKAAEEAAAKKAAEEAAEKKAPEKAAVEAKAQRTSISELMVEEKSQSDKSATHHKPVSDKQPSPSTEKSQGKQK